MEENKPILKTWLNFGLITAAIVIVLDLVFYVLDVPRESYIRFIAFLVYIGGLIWAAKSYRDIHSGGLISYGKSFTVSFMTGLLAAFIVSIYSYVFFEFIDPSIITETMEAQENTWLDNPDYSDEQIDQMMAFAERTATSTIWAIGAFIWTTIIVTLISLITSIFIKKEETPF